MDVTKIVITGGPCAGKSTALSRIQEEFTTLGYTVLFVPETATELINGGIAPWTCKNSDEFQKYLMQLQINKEKLFEKAASSMHTDKVLIVCDRGMLDNKAYMSNEGFNDALLDLNLNEIELRDSYDAVFHLVTAANGAEDKTVPLIESLGFVFVFGVVVEYLFVFLLFFYLKAFFGLFLLFLISYFLFLLLRCKKSLKLSLNIQINTKQQFD